MIKRPNYFDRFEVVNFMTNTNNGFVTDDYGGEDIESAIIEERTNLSRILSETVGCKFYPVQ